MSVDYPMHVNFIYPDCSIYLSQGSISTFDSIVLDGTRRTGVRGEWSMVYLPVHGLSLEPQSSCPTEFSHSFSQTPTLYLLITESDHQLFSNHECCHFAREKSGAGRERDGGDCDTNECLFFPTLHPPLPTHTETETHLAV
jgi:hypothetical protein